ERHRWLLRLGIAGLGMFQAMMMAEALYLDFDNTMPVATRDFFRWLTFLLSAPVVFYSGWPFLAGAWRELRQRRLGMDFLIASSTLLAYLASLVETIRGGEHVWYDAAVRFVFLLLAARMLEQRARNVASAQVDALARARPAFATRELAGGLRATIGGGAHVWYDAAVMFVFLLLAARMLEQRARVVAGAQGDGLGCARAALASRELAGGLRETIPLAALAAGDVACVAAGEAVP